MDCSVLIGEKVGVIAQFKNLTQSLISVFRFLRGAHTCRYDPVYAVFLLERQYPYDMLSRMKAKLDDAVNNFN